MAKYLNENLKFLKFLKSIKKDATQRETDLGQVFGIKEIATDYYVVREITRLLSPTRSTRAFYSNSFWRCEYQWLCEPWLHSFHVYSSSS